MISGHGTGVALITFGGGVETGAVLAGRYRLERLLGRGGMGEVWAGRDARLSRDVAVKVMTATEPDPEEVERFTREATVAAGLQHPGITVVFDAGEQDGRLFLVTELLSGRDLAKVLRERPGGLPLADVADLGTQLADALAAAHARGIIHRDLKPANLYLQTDGRLKICDFGLARDLTSATHLTQAGTIFGTPAYMAPEQWDVAPSSPSADLYAVGCILHQLVTGKVPFKGESMLALMAQHLTKTAVPLSEQRPDVPAALSDLVAALLAKKPADRPASAGVVHDVLASLREGPVPAAMLTGVQVIPPPPGPTAPVASRVILPSAPSPRPSGNSPLRRLHAIPATGRAAAFGPDGGLLAVSGGPGVVLWDVMAGREARALQSPPGVRAITFGPLLVAVAAGRTASLWEAATGRPVHAFSGHRGTVTSAAFSPNGALLATAGSDATVRLWDTATGNAVYPLTRLAPRGQDPAVAFGPDGVLLATSTAGPGPVLRSVATGQQARALAPAPADVAAVAFSPGGAQLATGGSDGTVRLWDVGTGQCRHVLAGGEAVRALAFRDDGQFLAAGDADGTVRLWDTSTGSAGHTLIPALRGTPSAVAFQPGGALLAVASTDGLRLLDTATGRAIPVPEECTGSDGVPAFSPDGTLLAVTGGPAALLWAV